MDIYDYLKLDHQKVSTLFKQFKSTNSKERQKQIIDLLTEELTVHLLAEQDMFYPILEEDCRSRHEAFHGLKEHQEIEDQIHAVKQNSSAKNWHDKVLKLKELVDHHVKEEEGDMFDKAKKVLSEAEACALKEKVHFRKMKYKDNLKKSKTVD
ncbi:hemerythrin domain-containing protein [Legionella jordanis]|uniref:DNA nickase n=1 Tax=Legionella jordanis TaxID=456 RepID=A0A0W0VBV6_9GAMM|nr:hemerythrin domain-containing protein [Legionella jordanis]KTD17113.1 DNA nickase [Legionella jordanis]RMX03244.1 hypothetical protein EAW55_07395 [Legionella jordanis]RMX18222.1 hypothetical protein EAS68_08930 [Legionella jordanis]VEH12690.1 Alr3199 protein [Legionella jordanis]HAT8713161.1 hypothetical protein [Legionella jordanis]